MPSRVPLVGEETTVRDQLGVERLGSGSAGRGAHPDADAGAYQRRRIGAEHGSAATRSLSEPSPAKRRPHVRTDDGVGLAERHARPDEELGEVGGRRRLLVGGGLHRLGHERRRGDHPGQRGDRERDLLDRVEQRLLVLLQVAVVGERQALQRREQAR